MRIEIALKSILREKLPPESGGRAVVEMSERSTLADIAALYAITSRVIFVVNGKVESDVERRLSDGDQVAVYVSAHGG